MSKQSVDIRPATPADKAALGDLWEAFLNEQAQHDSDLAPAEDARKRWENDYEGWLQDDGIFLSVAIKEAVLIGFAYASLTYHAPIYRAGKEAFLNELFVAPPHRRKGIGTRLLGEARAWAEEQEVRRLRLSTLYHNTAAREFWEAAGARAHAVTYVMDTNLDISENQTERSTSFGFT